MIRKYCDKCGKEVNYEVRVNFETEVSFNGCEFRRTCFGNQQYELCDECARDVIDFIESSDKKEE